VHTVTPDKGLALYGAPAVSQAHAVQLSQAERTELQVREAVWRAWFNNDRAALEKLLPHDLVGLTTATRNGTHARSRLKAQWGDMTTLTSGPLATSDAVANSRVNAGPSLRRIASVDIVRGIVMIIMALDHCRDFFSNLPFEPETLSNTYYALFFTRWITHFCAPLFFFLAGTGAFFYGRRHTRAELSHFLWTRGLWLIVLEFTVIGTSWSFLFPWGFFGVIWALGDSMVIMALLVRMPVRWLATMALLMIGAHDLFDQIGPQQFGSFAWLWSILHVRGSVFLPFHIPEYVLFPLVPWVGVMAAGYCFGTFYLLEEARRRKLLLQLGCGLTMAFCLLRITNLYGNPSVAMGGVSQGDWHVQPTLEKTLILFLDVEKYPPSLQFLLMTLGPAFLLLASLGKRDNQLSSSEHTSRLLNAFLVFGRVPMFFYILHLYFIHILAVTMAALFHQPMAWLFQGAVFGSTPDNYGYGLPFVYLMWATTIVILYFPCRWWAGLKQRRKDWWLSYL
jgi:uncharacterized membrane protein